MKTPLTIAVFGATGRTGRWVVQEAMARGLHVQAMVRPDARTTGLDHNGTSLVVLPGKVTDIGDVASVVAGAQAVICLLGPREPYKDVFCAAATEVILESMRSLKVGRLLVVTGAMIGSLTPAPAGGYDGLSWTMRQLASRFAQTYPHVARDRQRQEEIVLQSSVQWTLVRPPRLTDQLGGRKLAVGPHVPVNLWSKLSRRDLARFLVSEVEQPRHPQQAVVVRQA